MKFLEQQQNKHVRTQKNIFFNLRFSWFHVAHLLFFFAHTAATRMC